MRQSTEYGTAFPSNVVPAVPAIGRLEDITREWAWEGGTGRGIKVGVIDGGINAAHPLVGGVDGYVTVSEGATGPGFDTTPHGDSFGQGTACAGIIRALAADCELYSIRVVQQRRGAPENLVQAGLEWAITNGMRVCTLSVGTTRAEHADALHELADTAYFRNVVLVTAASSSPVPSFPSVYASVISVAAHAVPDPELIYYNPTPPVEFGAFGSRVRVAWGDDSSIVATGNSFAAAHVSGLVARLLSKHPDLTVFQVKLVLRALAANVVRDS